jgi:hypothetical protein
MLNNLKISRCSEMQNMTSVCDLYCDRISDLCCNYTAVAVIFVLLNLILTRH